MTNYFVPDYTLSPKELQDAFFYWASCQLYNISEPLQYSRWDSYRYPLRDNDQKAKLHQLYTEGFFVFRILKCSFEDFHFALTSRKGIYPGYYIYRRTYWYDCHKKDFREPLKYVRNENHSPKELSTEEVSRRDWREKKGFERDYRRSGRSAYAGRKTAAKKFSNKSYRNWESQTIRDGRFEDFFTGKCRHFFSDWDWD